jgi:RHS repeat-associated protein
MSGEEGVEVMRGGKYPTLSFAPTTFALIICLFAAAAACLGQDQQTKRGFTPGGSFALSDIETINMVNGNMILKFPLGSLPPERGGMSASINLLYNSKLWDTHVEYVPDLSNQISPQNFLGESEDGGWRYGINYQIRLLNRNQNMDSPPQCPDPHAFYIWKLQMIFPDGSTHDFRPTGFSDYNGEGYFTITPDGWESGCSGTVHSVTGPMTYFSTDGTYLRLVFTPGSGWTLSMADGGRVVTDAASQRIYDRNNDYLETAYVQNYNNSGEPAGVITDQLGRTIALQYDASTQEDLIRSSGFNNEVLTWRVKWKTIEVNKSYTTTCAGCGQVRGGTSIQELEIPLRVVDRITLPEQSGGLTYIFGYNADTSNPSLGWGELNSITLPSSAQATYGYWLDGSGPLQSNPRVDRVLDDHPTSKTLSYQQEYDGSSTPTTEIWHYAISHTASSMTAPDNGITSQTFGDTSYPNADTGLIGTTTRPDGALIERTWNQNVPYGLYASLPTNPFVKTEFTSIKDAAGNLSQTAIKDYSYDKNGNVTQVKEYDWVTYASTRGANGPVIPAGAPLKRITTNTYSRPTPDWSDSSSNASYSYWNPNAPTLRNAIAATEVSDGAATLARTEVFYDDPATTGNPTQKTTWDSAKGGYSNPLSSGNSVSVFTQYNQYGSPILATDARGIQTQFVYGLVGGVMDLYPTQIKTAFQTSVQRTETSEYDFYTGVVTRVTDADNNVSTSTTYDAFGRPVLVKAAEGKPEETRTATEYSDVNRRVIVRSDLNTVGDGKLVSVQHYDQLGRVRLTRQLEDAATQSATDETQGIKVQTRYSFSGQNSYMLSSNPYRAAYSSSAGTENTMGWARSMSDNGGRLIEVQTFGGGGLPAPWDANSNSTGTVTTAYDANFTTVTDQASKQRRSMVDALGRLLRVDEPDGSNSLGTTASPAQPTSYDYDVSGNLLHVYQGSQTRTFTYDSRSRLRSAVNPESGTLSYQYDNDGNLTQKTDARGVVSTYLYDALNRNYSVAYSNDPANTPAVTRTYDGATNGKGKLWTTQTSGNAGTLTTMDSYDALGRPLTERQQFYTGSAWSQSFSQTLSYDRAGHVLTEAYPSNRTVTNAYDSAGRTSSVTGYLGDGTQRTYSTGIIYDAASRMAKEQFGTATPVYNKLFYNVRGQLSEIRESTSYTGSTDTNSDRGAIINSYSLQAGCVGASCSATDNNGNLMRQDVYIPGSPVFSQFYGYDSLNRLQSVREDGPSGPANWQQAYTYDQYGNRKIGSAATWGNGINNIQAAVDPNTTTNRMYAPGETDQNHSLINYDNAGNQTKDYYSYSANGVVYDRTYDAENRMNNSTATYSSPASTQSATYTYDGDGRRVKRNIGGTETWQVYGLGGELLAEYAPNANPLTPQKEYGYRTGQLLITATAPSGLAANKPSDTKTEAVAASSPVSGKESTAAAQSFDLLASIKGLMLRLSGISTVTSAGTEAVSDASTPLFGPSFPYAASLNRSAIPLMPQSGSAKIAFASNGDGSGQIYSMNTDGSGLSRLTNDAANDEAPNWSPNNSRIVFQSDRDNLFSCIADIYVMNWDGSGQTRLTSDAADDSAPVWSPDGTKIAFQSARNGVNYQVYLMNADGSGQVNISNTTANDTQPSWSPDGSKIAFASDRDQTGFSSIYVMNANGSNQTRLTISGTGRLDQQPAWSPDGSRLTFTSTRDSITVTWQETDDNGGIVNKSALQVNKEVYVMNANGSAQVRLTNTLENDDSASWSGDGTKIVFRSDRERDCCDPTGQVWVMNPDGTSQVDLSNNGSVDHCPSWQHVAANMPPTVSLTTPASGATYIAPANITLTANAGDSDGSVSRVDFYQGVTLIGTATTSPYTVTWNNVAAGSYSLTARATDNLGATSTSAAVTITVNANAPPAVNITSPSSGAVFAASANITVTANASDSDGSISRVDFYQGATLIGTATNSPYTINWNSVAAGSYTLTARATDNLGATTTSALVNITVNAPPTVSITSPSNGANFTGPANITITANASDSDGNISRVDFYQGTTLVGTATTSPYTISWNNVTAGGYTLTARATDNLGASSTSSPVSISVGSPPTVSVTTPTNGASFTAPANVTVTANASSSTGSISRVEFYQGTTLIGTSTASPYTMTWNNVAAGSYVLKARAIDNSGASTDSTTVNISVNAPPTVSITSPTIGASFAAPANIPVTANASDSDGSINRVDFYQGTTLIGTATASPYNVSWNNVTTGTYSLTAKVTDNLGAQTSSTAVSVTVNAPAVADIRWIVTDQLGTPRMIFDQTGSLANVSRHDYLPFGEELTSGGRTMALGYGGADATRQRFTQKERDNETGLDFFEARYYGNLQGRFTRPDPYNIILETQATAEMNEDKARAQFFNYLSHPQNWNRYAYVTNNPLRYIDPTGEELWLTGTEEERRQELERIKQLVGKGAAKYLTTREVCTNVGTVTVVEYSSNAFAAYQPDVTTRLANIIDSKNVLEYHIATTFQDKNGTHTTEFFGGAATVGKEESLNGHTQIFVNPKGADMAQNVLGVPSVLAGSRSNDGKPLDFYDDIVDYHEFGHAYANMVDNAAIDSDQSNQRSLEFENVIRQRRGLSNRRVIH